MSKELCPCGMSIECRYVVTRKDGTKFCVQDMNCFASNKWLVEHDKQIRAEVKAEYESADIPIIHGKEELEEHDKQIRADILNEVSAKMEEIISDKCAEYGVGCIEAYCDACGEFEDWIKEQLKGAEGNRK